MPPETAVLLKEEGKETYQQQNISGAGHGNPGHVPAHGIGRPAEIIVKAGLTEAVPLVFQNFIH